MERWFVIDVEYERGWGSRVIGVIEVEDYDAAVKFRDELNEDLGKEANAPEVYFRAEISNDSSWGEHRLLAKEVLK